MGDLLRSEFPGLVPVSGGSDHGTDGAVPESDNEPFPLVCTTGKDVIGNLTSSLDSRLKLERPPGKVVLATSRRLTPRTRFNLEERARSKGFRLIQIFEQEGVADRLYRNSRWCKELLGLPGLAPALSVVPPTRRPLIDLEPIGRDADLEWLLETREDRVLTGEPGSGKTFLAYYLMRKKEWDALFLAGADEAAISAALRDQRPSIVVVDDAHVNPTILEKLVRLRRAMTADFAVLAMTWEGGKEQVTEALGGLPDSRVRKLQPLARQKILEVFQSAGVEEDNVTMRYLVDQASNKPGLAITIAVLWLQDAWQEVVNGTALRRNLLAFFQESVDSYSADILAAFSLGGDPGASLESVRGYLGIDLPRIRRVTAGLAAGGVLSEVERGILAVWPRLLRYALVREVFLSPSGPDYRPLLDKVESFEEGVETLIAAGHVAQKPSWELQPLVARTDSPRAWKAFAFTGEDAAQWVLNNYPRDLLDVADSCL
ncbi:MAG TPA: hypothetical protein VLQ45_17840, partial [Thermoanaerobaculia bacterium]|nr:hypothetical protein [Thermoanaerobaculia bacterium]